MNQSFREFLAGGGVFQGYTYAYPHKTAYRSLSPSRHLGDVWSGENKDSLFLYAHVPFCEMRCGFCNLFTTTHPGTNLVVEYLDALEGQAESVAAALGNAARFSRLAIGGGTPTFLTLPELQRLFGFLNKAFLRSGDNIPKVIEASPATVDGEKVSFLKEQKISRVSLGVQSFVEAEVRALGRSQRLQDVHRALSLLTFARFGCVNIDLIYGIKGQTATTWRYSLDQALEFVPEEIYLYPLYVRPLTHLDKAESQTEDSRQELYRTGRDYLLERGYRQISMRLFRKNSYTPAEGPVYCCQEDGMVGLGPGARSYTAGLHYSTEYAVGRPGVMEVIAHYNTRTRDQFAYADYGFVLNQKEKKRRYLIKSLLRCDGLDLEEYQAAFGSNMFDDFPQISELLDNGFFLSVGGCIQPTLEGLELSDVIGPWLWSAPVREMMGEYELR